MIDTDRAAPSSPRQGPLFAEALAHADSISVPRVPATTERRHAESRA